MNRTARVALALALVVALAGSRAAAAPELEALNGRAIAGGKPMADVVIWLDAPSAPRPRERRFVVHQRNMQFEPRVLVAPVGSTVELPNNDRVFHNVFSFKDGKRFDLGLYPVGTSKFVTFDQPGLSRIFCNIHPTMAAYVMAVDSSLVGVSDADGKLEIAGARPGRYEYHAWRPGAEIISGSLTVSAGREIEVAWP